MEPLEAFRPLIQLDNRFTKEWKRLKKPVLGCASSYIPEEIAYAGGILPVRVFGSLEPSKLADVYLPVNVCSYAKSCFNKALKGEYSLLDAYVVSNSCDNQTKIHDFWKHCAPIRKTHFINTPHTTTENSLKFFLKELEKLKGWLTDNFGVEISEDNLKTAIKIYNENRKLLKQVYEFRKLNPPLISGSEAFEVVLSSMTIPKDKHNKLLSELLGTIEKRQNPPKKAVRLLVSGSAMGNPELLKLIESVGGSVVADDLCTGSRYFWNLAKENGEPMRAIGERYLHNIPCPYMSSSDERFKHVTEMIKPFKVEGVIVFLLKFCDVHAFDAPSLTEELRKKAGLPVLTLEWEHSLSGIAQLKTRIEAFIETVGGIG